MLRAGRERSDYAGIGQIERVHTLRGVKAGRKSRGVDSFGRYTSYQMYGLRDTMYVGEGGHS